MARTAPALSSVGGRRRTREEGRRPGADSEALALGSRAWASAQRTPDNMPEPPNAILVIGVSRKASLAVRHGVDLSGVSLYCGRWRRAKFCARASPPIDLEREEMFYLHVPKTGGQTLATRLASAFDPDKVHMFQGNLEFPRDREKLGALLGQKEFIESHVTGAMLSEPIDRPILCTIREPIGQMVSNWRHIRRDSSNRWHRAALSLSAAEFFDNLGDYFTNHQTNYVISSFVQLRDLIDRRGYYRALNHQLQSSVDRIRWLVPTESIDEFVDLWSAETKRQVPNRKATINVAPPETQDLHGAHAAIRARPHLYAFDQLLYQMTKDRFAQYRSEVAELVAPWSYPEDSRRAYRMERGGIWLTENWYDPEISGGQRAWWSGPQRVSEVRVWRANGEKFLRFFVKGVNGITYRDIVAKSKETGEELPTVRTESASGDGMNYSIALDSLREKDAISLIAPECYPSIMTTSNDTSLVRQSFIAANWTLAETPCTAGGEATASEEAAVAPLFEHPVGSQEGSTDEAVVVLGRHD
jgi:hypothetical protein